MLCMRRAMTTTIIVAVLRSLECPMAITFNSMRRLNCNRSSRTFPVTRDWPPNGPWICAFNIPHHPSPNYWINVVMDQLGKSNTNPSLTLMYDTYYGYWCLIVYFSFYYSNDLVVHSLLPRYVNDVMYAVVILYVNVKRNTIHITLILIHKRKLSSNRFTLFDEGN